jgi:hypothetical protein
MRDSKVKDGRFVNSWPEHNKKKQQAQVEFYAVFCEVSDNDIGWARMKIHSVQKYQKVPPMPKYLTTIQKIVYLQNLENVLRDRLRQIELQEFAKANVGQKRDFEEFKTAERRSNRIMLIAAGHN